MSFIRASGSYLWRKSPSLVMAVIWRLWVSNKYSLSSPQKATLQSAWAFYLMFRDWWGILGRMCSTPMSLGYLSAARTIPSPRQGPDGLKSFLKNIKHFLRWVWTFNERCPGHIRWIYPPSALDAQVDFKLAQINFPRPFARRSTKWCWLWYDFGQWSGWDFLFQNQKWTPALPSFVPTNRTVGCRRHLSTSLWKIPDSFLNLVLLDGWARIWRC
jgi:hypothetical protein